MDAKRSDSKVFRLNKISRYSMCFGTWSAMGCEQILLTRRRSGVGAVYQLRSRVAPERVATRAETDAEIEVAAEMRKPRYAIWVGKLDDSDRGCAWIEIYTSAPQQT
jgi:hypothetical protein